MHSVSGEWYPTIDSAGSFHTELKLKDTNDLLVKGMVHIGVMGIWPKNHWISIS